MKSPQRTVNSAYNNNNNNKNKNDITINNDDAKYAKIK